MSENETLADIRKESEELFREFCTNWIGTKKLTYGCEQTQALLRFNGIFDRIEAATQREREKLSSCYVRSTHEAARIIARCGEVNAAKMYKALITIREKCIIYNNALAEEIDAICGNAISEPARNCDVYDKEEVRMAYHLHGDGLMSMQAVVDWLYSAKKERGDESPRTEQESEVQGC